LGEVVEDRWGSEGVPTKNIQPPIAGRLYIENVPKVVTYKNIVELFRTFGTFLKEREVSFSPFVTRQGNPK